MSKVPENIIICLSADNNYAQHMGVLMCSIIKNLNPDYKAHFYVLDGGITEDNKQKIAQLQNIKPFDIDYVDMAQYDFEFCTKTHLPHTTVATYFRLRAPSLFLNLDKMIYLDCDIVVNQDLSELWSVDLQKSLVGAVHDLSVANDYFFKTFGVCRRYFNAGVLLINLAAMREQNCEAQFFETLAAYNYSLLYDDQDVLNAVCADQVLWLPPKYNVLNGYTKKHTKPVDFSMSPYTRQQLLEAKNKPVILHYIGSKKPWHYGCKHHLAYLYRHYIKFTPWHNYKLADKTVTRILWHGLFLIRREFKHRLKVLFSNNN